MSGLGLLTAVFLVMPMLIAGYLGNYAWNRRSLPGASSFAWMMLVVISWCLCAVLILISSDPTAARFWLNLMLVTTPYLPVAILATCAQSTGHGNIVRPGRLVFWLIIPTMTAILSLTSNSQTLYLGSGVEFVQVGGQNVGWTNQFGPWSIVHLSYSYALIIYGFVLLIQQFMKMRFGTYRNRILLILVGMLLPFIGNVYGTLGTNIHYFTTPILFNISAPILFWALFRYRLFELAPIARDQAFEHMSDAIVIVDNENRIVDVNPSAAVLANLPASQIIAKPVSEVFSTHQPIFKRVMEVDSEVLSTQVEDGERYFDLRMTPIKRDEEQVGKLIILRDITEQHLAEVRAHQMEIEREGLHTVSHFMQAASHEFRTPLAIIKTAAYLADRSDDKTKRTEKTAQINTQVDRLTLLVEGLLTIVRLNTAFELPLETLDINPLIREVEQKLRTQAEAKSLRVEVCLAPTLPLMSANADYLESAIYAVMHNAIRYTPANGSIILSTLQQDGCIVVKIQDSGIGIAPEHLPHIFDVFYRGDQAHTTAGFGTGLAIANRVVALHGGTIQPTSAANEGTTIQMTFPLVKSNGS